MTENAPGSLTAGPPSDLSALVNYGEGSVVSRTLEKSPAGTLTLFAFDAGCEISEHATPHEAFAVGLEGDIDVTVGGESHRLETGEILRLPAHVPHALKTGTRSKMLLLMFKRP